MLRREWGFWFCAVAGEKNYINDGDVQKGTKNRGGWKGAKTSPTTDKRYQETLVAANGS